MTARTTGIRLLNVYYGMANEVPGESKTESQPFNRNKEDNLIYFLSTQTKHGRSGSNHELRNNPLVSYT